MNAGTAGREEINGNDSPILFCECDFLKGGRIVVYGTVTGPEITPVLKQIEKVCNNGKDNLASMQFQFVSSAYVGNCGNNNPNIIQKVFIPRITDVFLNNGWEISVFGRPRKDAFEFCFTRVPPQITRAPDPPPRKEVVEENKENEEERRRKLEEVKARVEEAKKRIAEREKEESAWMRDNVSKKKKKREGA